MEIRRAPHLTDGAVRRGRNGPARLRVLLGLSAAASTVTTVKIGGAMVLANSKGFTLYSFGPDTPTKSNCNGTCATLPPARPRATA
jgi:predicted lipoprotein with Yx(FWY)xxD motif